MSQLIKILDSATAVSPTAGAATTINGSRCVRISNKTTGIATIGIATGVGAGSTQYFAMQANTTVFFQKKATDVVWAQTAIGNNTAVEANNVGFTN